MVRRMKLENGYSWQLVQGGTYAEIVPLGASIRSILVPDRDGTLRDVCLGYETVLDYAAQGGCLGSVVGRYANRISGAAFSINGRHTPLLANEGPNTCHGGGFGYHKRWWRLEALAPNSLSCTLESPDGDEGFPGRLRLEIIYTWDGSALTIDYKARADADTVINLTNHAYFNLAGHDGGEVGDHILTLNASRFTPIGPDKIPTGELKDVAGTPWDFRTPTPLSQGWESPELAPAEGFDHNFCLDGGDGPAARLSCPRTGIVMEMFTDRPGCQLYTAGSLKPRAGKSGVQYGPRQGVCLETQNYPNAVNTPGFPSAILRSGQVWESKTVYKFSVE